MYVDDANKKQVENRPTKLTCERSKTKQKKKREANKTLF